MIFLALLFRILWQLHPSLWACTLFWLVVASMEFRYTSRADWQTRLPVWVGIGMNALVTLANDGRMPVLGKFHPVSVWVVGTGRHLLFLCDRFHGFSLGDFLIIGGIVLSPLLLWLFRPEDGAKLLDGRSVKNP